MTASEVIEKILSILGEFESAIDIAMMVCMILINKNCGKISKTTSQSTATTVAATTGSEALETEIAKKLPPTVSDSTLQAEKRAAAKAKMREEMLSSLEVMFSDKTDAELTDVEQTQVAKVLAFINGGKNEIS